MDPSEVRNTECGYEYGVCDLSVYGPVDNITVVATAYLPWWRVTSLFAEVLMKKKQNKKNKNKKTLP